MSKRTMKDDDADAALDSGVPCSGCVDLPSRKSRRTSSFDPRRRREGPRLQGLGRRMGPARRGRWPGLRLPAAARSAGVATSQLTGIFGLREFDAPLYERLAAVGDEEDSPEEDGLAPSHDLWTFTQARNASMMSARRCQGYWLRWRLKQGCPLGGVVCPVGCSMGNWRKLEKKAEAPFEKRPHYRVNCHGRFGGH